MVRVERVSFGNIYTLILGDVIIAAHLNLQESCWELLIAPGTAASRTVVV